MRAALFAACVLVLQAAAGALALGSAAASPALDAFGNPLCVGGTAVQQAPDGVAPGLLPDCCTAACALFAPGTAGAAPHSLANPLAPVSVVAFPAPSGVGPAASHAHGPGNPRAPPPAA